MDKTGFLRGPEKLKSNRGRNPVLESFLVHQVEQAGRPHCLIWSLSSGHMPSWNSTEQVGAVSWLKDSTNLGQ